MIKSKSEVLMKMKFYIWFLFLPLLWGCESNSTYVETPIVLEDQSFHIEENSPSGTVIGQIQIANNTNAELSYFLVSGDNSYAFELDSTDGRLVLKDSTLIDHEKYEEISLEVMVSYKNSRNEYGFFANATILVDNISEPFTLVLDATSGKDQDALISSLHPSTNYDKGQFLYAADWTSDLTENIYRSLLQFDLSSIPTDAQITKAVLFLYNPNDGDTNHEHSQFSGPNGFYIRRITSEWESSTVAWDNQPTYTTDDQTLLSASTSTTQDYLDIDVLPTIESMVKYPASNYGFMIMLENEAYYRRICFASMDHSDQNLRPKMEITYLE